MIARRGFLLGLGAALAAPAIVRAEVLMPVRSLVMPPAPSILTLNGNTMLTPDILAKEALHILRRQYLIGTIWHESGRKSSVFGGEL